jgi:sarcosine oxidase gamma subunit
MVDPTVRARQISRETGFHVLYMGPDAWFVWHPGNGCERAEGEPGYCSIPEQLGFAPKTRRARKEEVVARLGAWDPDHRERVHVPVEAKDHPLGPGFYLVDAEGNVHLHEEV